MFHVTTKKTRNIGGIGEHKMHLEICLMTADSGCYVNKQYMRRKPGLTYILEDLKNRNN